jgi:hypothetical protein
MFRRIIVAISAMIICCGVSVAIADPPESASVSGVVNVGWKPGNCAVDSFGQLE